MKSKKEISELLIESAELLNEGIFSDNRSEDFYICSFCEINDIDAAVKKILFKDKKSAMRYNFGYFSDNPNILVSKYNSLNKSYINKQKLYLYKITCPSYLIRKSTLSNDPNCITYLILSKSISNSNKDKFKLNLDESGTFGKVCANNGFKIAKSIDDAYNKIFIESTELLNSKLEII